MAHTTCPAMYAPCAGKCEGAQVTARRTRATVVLGPCSYVVAQGWTGRVGVVLTEGQARSAGVVLHD